MKFRESFFSVRREMHPDDGIQNCVCYFRLAIERSDGTIAAAKLNLPRLYLEKRDRWPLRYDPNQFGSANIRFECRSLGLKNVAALIFSTGKVVCPGTSSPQTGLIMAHVITSEVSRMMEAPFVMRDFRVPNIVARILTHPVDIARMAEVLGGAKARYEPTGPRPFPACFVFPHRDAAADRCDKVVYLVFDSGKVVITGCASEEDVIANMAEARQICLHFPKRALTGGPAIERAAAIREADRAVREIGDAIRPKPLLAFSGGERYVLEAPP